ncbi:MAG: hypothetical protein HND48_16255 [Chloroflexi bacterium]|nr:hypothetical protein [Chloroflexota bacterium]
MLTNRVSAEESEQAEHELKRGHQQRKREQRNGRFGVAERRQRAGYQQHEHVGGRDRDESRTAQQTADDGREDAGIQAVDRVDAAQQREPHRLRRAGDRAGQARSKIRPKARLSKPQALT